MDSTSPYMVDWTPPQEDIRFSRVIHAALLLLVVRFALVALGFQKTATVVDRFSRTGASRIDVDHAQVRSLRYEVSLAAAFVPARILCLERSLVLYQRLKCNGAPVALRLGVRAYPFQAHAWVELEGSPVNEIPDRLKDFQPIFQLG